MSEIENEGHENEQDGDGDRPRRKRKPAREKVMDLIARRDHSELELRRKLAANYEPDEVEDAIDHARQNKWLKAPDELAETVAAQLDRRHKGSRYINRYLSAKGLPRVAKNRDEELKKAMDLIQMRLRLDPPFAYVDWARIARLLQNRGFDDDVIREVVHTT